jgi:hypothetical protein
MLTTAQVVAELGWARKAIKDVIGVTPTLMRPPFGDIDDRVRAISLAMGMVPVIWTSTGTGATFDTNGQLSQFYALVSFLNLLQSTIDWKVPGGVVTGTQSFATFEAILGNATMLNTGWVQCGLLPFDLTHFTFLDLLFLSTIYTHKPLTLLLAIRCLLL